MKINFINVSRIAFVICILSVSYLALLPIAQLPDMPSYDKANHFIAFLVLTVLFCFAQFYRQNAVIWLSGYGILLEVLQGATTFRHFSYNDLKADVFGIVIGLLLTKILRPYLRAKKINYKNKIL